MDTQHVVYARSDMSGLLTYRQDQRRRTLTIILVTVMLATALFGALNLFFYAASDPAIVFFVTSFLCLPALWLNRRGYYLLAEMIAAVVVLIAAHYNLVDGAGIHDPGVVAYPIIIIIGGLLFGKRIVPLFTLIGIGSLIAVVYVQSSFADGVERLVIISVLLLVAAVTTWVIMGNMDKYIAQIKQSEINLRHAYEQTEAQAQQVRRIIETVPEGVLLLDAERHILLANQTAQNFLNILTPFYDKNLPLERLGETFLTEIMDVTREGVWQEIQVSDPEYIFEVAACPVQRELTLSQDWVLVLRDVTLKRKQQEAIQAKDRLATVGQLAAGIAHDFRNILTVISTYSQILRAKPDTPKRHDYLTLIQNQSKDAAHLIQQILDFSRHSVMERKVTDMVDLVEELISLLQRTMPSNIPIQFEHNPGQYTLIADKTHLQQALMNLAVNARDAMPNGGRLQFTLLIERPAAELEPDLETEGQPWLCLRVSDTGQGIGATDLPHIFEPFYTKKEVGKGTGLGLAQVYGIVKQHEGVITVRSTVGAGTTFYLYFPVVLEKPVSLKDSGGELITMAQETTILLAEDNPFTRKSTEEMLNMLGCRVITADNGKDALTILQTQQSMIDLIISDIVMPEMGGLELYQKLQEVAPNLKMLIITGYPLNEQAKMLLEQEAVEWIEKPYEAAEIALKINNALSQ
jgi:two-component system, cell cycle sensor histidine kinase and response regulator CckA